MPSAALLFAALLAVPSGPPVPRVARVFVIVLENESPEVARRQPFLGALAKQGAYLARFFAVEHPSYPNYLALTSGSTWSVRSNQPRVVDARNIADLLEERGKAWKVYAEDYPGHCFLGEFAGEYASKHVPLLSYRNVRDDPKRCSRIVNATELRGDLERGALPDFALYVPNLKNDGHDTGVRYADRWLARSFGPLLRDPRFTDGLLLAVVFDEDDGSARNRIYAALWGEAVRSGAVSERRYDHYSLLRTIEEALGLGTLGARDAAAAPIDDVWRR
jgi:Phosphoesterase family